MLAVIRVVAFEGFGLDEGLDRRRERPDGRLRCVKGSYGEVDVVKGGRTARRRTARLALHVCEGRGS